MLKLIDQIKIVLQNNNELNFISIQHFPKPNNFFNFYLLFIATLFFCFDLIQVSIKFQHQRIHLICSNNQSVFMIELIGIHQQQDHFLNNDMDKLKEILAKNKPQAKLISNKEILAKERSAKLAEIEQYKKEKQQSQARRLKQVEQFYSEGRKIKPSEQEPQPPLEINQIKAKLRELYQPVTLFGQTNYKRYLRYLKAKQFHEQNPNEDMKLYDEEFAKKIKQNQQFQQLDAKYRQSMIEPRLMDDISLRQKKLRMILQEKGVKNFDEMCNESYLWMKKVLNEWGEALEHKNYDRKHLDAVRRKYQIFEETKFQLSSLERVLKSHKGDKDMLISIYHIMNCCLVREYVQANDKYIQLSVGNAPWPMGEAMLSISVRKNAQKLSHVLDQEMTRKWMQGIKRLISVSEQLYPNEQDSKMTHFTSNTLI